VIRQGLGQGVLQHPQHPYFPRYWCHGAAYTHGAHRCVYRVTAVEASPLRRGRKILPLKPYLHVLLQQKGGSLQEKDEHVKVSNCPVWKTMTKFIVKNCTGKMY
jgi:hypothetical protein